jgi:hypothetical protein
VLVKQLKGLLDVGLGALGGLGIEGHDLEDRVQPGRGGQLDLVGGEVDPLIDQRLKLSREMR